LADKKSYLKIPNTQATEHGEIKLVLTYRSFIPMGYLSFIALEGTKHATTGKNNQQSFPGSGIIQDIGVRRVQEPEMVDDYKETVSSGRSMAAAYETLKDLI
ncbi:hypothetical protein STEG23_037391, partial [Scotinomys teguina]